MLPDMMIMGNNKSNNLSLMKELFEKENKPLILLGSLIERIYLIMELLN